MKECPACLQPNSGDVTTCTSCGYRFKSSYEWQETPLSEVNIERFSAGDLFADRYEVVRELGRGGMGMVYLVKDKRLQEREAALKMIHPNLVKHPEARQRFEQEVSLCLDLLHPNIVRVYNLEEWENHQYFTMEYVGVSVLLSDLWPSCFLHQAPEPV